MREETVSIDVFADITLRRTYELADENRVAVHHLLKYLDHASTCRSRKCPRPICSTLRRYISHAKQIVCRDVLCALCKEIFVVTLLHQQKCHKRRRRQCRVPLCGTYKGPMPLEQLALKMIENGTCQPLLQAARADIQLNPVIAKADEIEKETGVRPDLTTVMRNQFMRLTVNKD